MSLAPLHRRSLFELVVDVTIVCAIVLAQAACPDPFSPASGEGEGPAAGEGEGSSEGAGEGSSEGEGEGEGEGASAPVDVVVNEIDCHGIAHIELLAAPGIDLGGVVLSAGSASFTVPPGSVTDANGLLVVTQGHGASAGFTFALACSDASVAVVSAGATVDTTTLAPFPGSYDGTSWCRLPDATGPFRLCTPSIGLPNQPYLDPEGVLFDAFNPVQIDLAIDAAGIDALTTDPRTDVKATFTLTQGATTYGPLVVGVGLKGSNAGSFRFLSQKAAFKINFATVVANQRFLGLRELKLNNMVEDHTLVHENLAYRMLAAMGIPAARAGYAMVTVTTGTTVTAYGLHAVIEALDATWASQHFASVQHIYENTDVIDLVPNNAALFSIHAGSKTNTGDLVPLLLVSQASAATFLPQLQASVDVPHTLQVWMASQYLMDWDGYAGAANNYYFLDDASGKFSFVPSGLDQALDPLDVGMTSYDMKTGKSPLDPAGILFARCVADAQCTTLVDDALAEIEPSILAFDAVTLFDALVAEVEPFVQADTRLDISLPVVHAAQAESRTFIVDRTSVLP